MEDKMIITIDRQYGSGGREIGELLSQRLNIDFYDKEIITEAEKESDLTKEVIETFDETWVDSAMYSLVTDTRAGRTGLCGDNLSIAEQAFLAEFNAIKKLANEKSCIFIGRCADYVLQEYENCINFFVLAPLEERIKRICKRDHVKPMEAEIIVKKGNKAREQYYNYYTNRKWGAAGNYDMTIDTARIGSEGAAALMEQFAECLKNVLV